MNQNEQQTSNADTNLNDLAVTEAEQAEIKGGPKKIFIGGLSITEAQTGLPDLEPQGEIKGGGGIVSEGQGYGIQATSSRNGNLQITQF